MPTIRSLLAWGAEILNVSSPTPRLDSELLLSYVSGQPRVFLFSRSEEEMPPETERQYRELVELRRQHVPIAYLRGRQEFYGRDFKVSPSVLIPRAETELIIDLSLKFLKQHVGDLRFIDLGTGSGAIAVTLAAELTTRGRNYSGIAVDLSRECLEVAQYNTATLVGQGVISFVQADWLTAIRASGPFDLILSNPPYVPSDLPNCSPEVRHEPRAALDGGLSGLDDILLLIKEVPRYLKPGGAFFCEIGDGQFPEIKQACEATEHQLQLISHDDLAGISRIFEIQQRSNL